MFPEFDSTVGLGLLVLFIFTFNFFIFYAAVIGWYGGFTFLGLANILLLGITPIVGWVIIPSIGRGITSIFNKTPKILKHKPSPAGFIIEMVILVIFLLADGNNLYTLTSSLQLSIPSIKTSISQLQDAKPTVTVTTKYPNSQNQPHPTLTAEEVAIENAYFIEVNNWLVACDTELDQFNYAVSKNDGSYTSQTNILSSIDAAQKVCGFIGGFNNVPKTNNLEMYDITLGFGRRYFEDAFDLFRIGYSNQDQKAIDGGLIRYQKGLNLMKSPSAFLDR
jgi:hypothetical protein